MNKRIGIVTAIILSLSVVVYVIGKPYYDLHFEMVHLNENEVTVYLPSGCDLDEVADSIASNHIMSRAHFISFAEKLNLNNTNLAPGKYKFQNGMKAKNVIYGLKNGNQELKDIRITFNNCLSLEDMAGKVAVYIEADSTSLIAYLKSPKTIEHFGFKEETMISLFLPDTYEVGEWDMDEVEFVEFMANQYKVFWNDTRKASAAKLNLSQSEITTLASIIEAEQSINTVEWRTIAGLYLNRVKRGMKLESDPTFKYCWGDELKGVQRLLNKHREIDCPYNTYIYPGIPPGPIRMASKNAIDAILNAEKHDYLFMCAKPGTSGLHNFAVTNAQHEANARKWYAYARSAGL
jgi:UPF0755 protein